ELAQALVRLGAVTAAGLAPGDDVAAAFDGTLLDRPSGGTEQPVKEALLVEYLGVYAPSPPSPLLTGDPGRTQQTLSYKLVRPARVELRVETPGGVVLRDLPMAELQAGAGALTWDGRLPGGSRAFGGAYVAHLVVTSTVGTSELRVPFRFRR